MNQSVLFLSIFVFICMLSSVSRLVISSSFPEFLVGATDLATSRHPFSQIPLSTGCGFLSHGLMSEEILFLCIFVNIHFFHYLYHIFDIDIPGWGSWYRPNRPSATAFIRPLQDFSTDGKSLAPVRYGKWQVCGWLVVESRGMAQIGTLKKVDRLIGWPHTVHGIPDPKLSSYHMRFSPPMKKF